MKVVHIQLSGSLVSSWVQRLNGAQDRQDLKPEPSSTLQHLRLRFLRFVPRVLIAKAKRGPLRHILLFFWPHQASNCSSTARVFGSFGPSHTIREGQRGRDPLEASPAHLQPPAVLHSSSIVRFSVTSQNRARILRAWSYLPDSSSLISRGWWRLFFNAQR